MENDTAFYFGRPLSLDYISELRHKDCKGDHGRGVFAIIQDATGDFVLVDKKVPCKSWLCLTCRVWMLRRLRCRIFNGPMAQRALLAGPNGSKLLTLTLPGREWREKHSRKEAKKLAQRAWDKLRRALKRSFGEFDHFKVMETQKDGYVHFHVLLVGDAVRPKRILESIRRLWSYKYFGCFANVDIRTVKDFQHSVRYVTKYMLKKEYQMQPTFGVWWSASRGALNAVWKPIRDGLPTFFSMSSKSTERTVVIDSDEKISFMERLSELKNRVSSNWLSKRADDAFQELDEFFMIQGMVSRFNKNLEDRGSISIGNASPQPA